MQAVPCFSVFPVFLFFPVFTTRLARFVLLLVGASAGMAQTEQQGAKPGWPCVPGRAVDPSYLEVSESTGGQTFLLQKNEASQSGVIMSSSFTHPDTLFRAVGQMAGTRTFEFPVDTSVESLLVMASIQCRQTVAVMDPGGAEMTAANALQSIDLQAGKIVRVDQPSVGNWQVRIAGQGLFILGVKAKTSIKLSGVKFDEAKPKLGVAQPVHAWVGKGLSNPSFHLTAGSGETLADISGSPVGEYGEFLLDLTPNVERFRIMVEGTDETGRPVRRMHPNLFHAVQAQ